MTDQPNLFIDPGVHPSYNDICQHQIIYGKLNVSVPFPPPYKRKVWALLIPNTYFQSIHSEWHWWDNDIKESLTISEFRRKPLAVKRQKQTSVSSVYDRIGIQNVTKLRLHFSPLNDHRVRHNCDCFNPRCLFGIRDEDNEHFLLHRPQFGLEPMDLFRQLAEVPDLDRHGFKSFM